MSKNHHPVSGLLPVHVVSTGSYLPTRILNNEELSRMVDTSDEWIITRTGIKERRLAAENEVTSDMAVKASLHALHDAHLKPEDVELIICATVTPDTIFPSTACWVQKKLKAVNAFCFDQQAACSGFIFALETARMYLASGQYRNALVIGADKLSSITDWKDRNTCVLFGDGAAAAVLKSSSHMQGRGIIRTVLGSNGEHTDILNLPAGGSLNPPSHKTVDDRMHCLRMNGKETYKQAVTAMCQASEDVIRLAGLKPSDIKCVIPHQANIRIIQAVAERLEMPMERVFINVDKYGNTSAAAVAIALDEAQRTCRFQRGDHIVLVAFGGGLTWGASLIQW